MFHTLRIRPLILFLVLACVAIAPPAGASSRFEVLASQRANSATQTLTFRLPRPRTNISEVRLRSGSLGLHVVGVEISFADVGTVRATLDIAVPPGHETPPVSVDAKRAISEVFVTCRPAPRPGETTIQLLARFAP